MLGFWWILLNLTALVIGQGCSPTFSWSGRNCGVNCEACLNIRFNNVGRGDQACLRRSTFAPPTSTSCIFQGNLNGDGSFIAVTSSTLSRIDCQRSLKDLEVRQTLLIYQSIHLLMNSLIFSAITDIIVFERLRRKFYCQEWPSQSSSTRLHSWNKGGHRSGSTGSRSRCTYLFTGSCPQCQSSSVCLKIVHKSDVRKWRRSEPITFIFIADFMSKICYWALCHFRSSYLISATNKQCAFACISVLSSQTQTKAGWCYIVLRLLHICTYT